MRVADRLALIDRIGRELQARYTFAQLDEYFVALGVPLPTGENLRGSKWVYAKAALTPLDADLIERIADELEIALEALSPTQRIPPDAWVNSYRVRVFISHVSREKLKATRLRDCFEAFSISGFVAHEDIKPTKLWEQQIERALRTMDGFVSLHTDGFRDSCWTNQEVGFAIARQVPFVSVKFDEDPVGFAAKAQAIGRGNHRAEHVAKKINDIFLEDSSLGPKLRKAQFEHAQPFAHEEEFPF